MLLLRLLLVQVQEQVQDRVQLLAPARGRERELRPALEHDGVRPSAATAASASAGSEQDRDESQPLLRRAAPAAKQRRSRLGGAVRRRAQSVAARPLLLSPLLRAGAAREVPSSFPSP